MAAPNTSPVFCVTPVLAYAKVSVANDTDDGSGAIEYLLTGAENGTRINLFRIFASTANSAGKLRFYLNFGTTWVPWFERTASATSEAPTVKGWLDEFEPPITTYEVIPFGVKLGVSTLVANTYHVTVSGGNY